MGLERAGQVQVCPSCGVQRADAYCGACGEKSIDHHDYSLKHFAHHASHEFLHVDGKIFRTLKVLITQPGKLTQEYFLGRRLPYVDPLRLMLALAALYIFVASFNHEKSLFNIASPSNTLYRSEKMQVIGRYVLRMSNKYQVAPEQVMEAVEERYHHAASISVVFTPLLLGAAMQLVFRRRYYVEQLVFSLHYISFTLILGALTWPLVVLFSVPGLTLFGTVLKIFVFGVNLRYLYLAVRRYYAESTSSSVAKTVYIGLMQGLSNAMVYVSSFIFALVYTSNHGV